MNQAHAVLAEFAFIGEEVMEIPALNPRDLALLVLLLAAMAGWNLRGIRRKAG